jgi:hypothetical protein
MGCNEMYNYDPPQASVTRGSAVQNVDGNLRVRVPGFRSRASSVLGETLVAQYLSELKLFAPTQMKITYLSVKLPESLLAG